MVRSLFERPFLEGTRTTFVPGKFRSGTSPERGRQTQNSFDVYPGAGLVNHRNACFMNSTIQALTHSPPLLKSATTEIHEKDCPRRKEGIFCGLCAFETHIRKMCVKHHGRPKPQSLEFYPVLMDQLLRERHISVDDQNCAHEFYTFFLDWLRKQEFPLAMESDYQSNRLTELQLRKSWLHQQFYATILTRKTCLGCWKSDVQEESCNDFRVYPGKDIKESLRVDLATEFFDGENKLTCNHCKRKQAFLWEKRFESLPTILTFSPIGVDWDTRRNRPRKNETNPWRRDDGHAPKCAKDLAIDVTSLTKFDEGPKSQSIKNMQKPTTENQFSKCRNNYEPYAAIVHFGGATSGHYVTLINKAQGPVDAWFLYNDEQVEEVETSRALALVEHSMLVFSRRTSPGPSDPLSESSLFSKIRDLKLSISIVDGKTVFSPSHSRSVSSASTATGGGGDTGPSSVAVPARQLLTRGDTMTLTSRDTPGLSCHSDEEDEDDDEDTDGKSAYASTLEGPNGPATPRSKISRQVGRNSRHGINRQLEFHARDRDAHILASQLSPCKRLGDPQIDDEAFTRTTGSVDTRRHTSPRATDVPSKSMSFPVSRKLFESTVFREIIPPRDANDRDFDRGKCKKSFKIARAASIAGPHNYF